MTESEKARAYDEALKRAASMLKVAANEKEAIDYVSTIFPELAESEDERIRKAIIDFLWKEKIFLQEVHSSVENNPKYRFVMDAIAWLEKQGKPTTIDINPSEFEMRLNKLLKQFESLPKEDIVSSLSFYLNVIQNDGTYKAEEKQGEQKPAVIDFKAKNWYVSKVDGKIHNIYYSVDKVEPKFKVRYAGGEYNVLEVKDIAGVTFYGIEDEPNHIDYVKAENCEIISGYAIKENGSPYPTKSAVFSEKKPTAWSEEDEKMYRMCIDAVEYYHTPEDESAIRDWLKSLKDRVSWKPSKKQMETLEYYMHTLLATEYKEVLFGLYNDLKKL